MYQWLNRTAAVCCLLQSVNSWIDWLGYWWRLVAGVDLFVAALKVSITWLDGWRLARSSGSAEDRSRLFVSFPLVSSRSSIKESETCLCEQWLIFDCSQFYCHLGFKTTNKGLVDLKFSSGVFISCEWQFLPENGDLSSSDGQIRQWLI